MNCSTAPPTCTPCSSDSQLMNNSSIKISMNDFNFVFWARMFWSYFISGMKT